MYIIAPVMRTASSKSVIPDTTYSVVTSSPMPPARWSRYPRYSLQRGHIIPDANSRHSRYPHYHLWRTVPVSVPVTRYDGHSSLLFPIPPTAWSRYPQYDIQPGHSIHNITSHVWPMYPFTTYGVVTVSVTFSA